MATVGVKGLNLADGYGADLLQESRTAIEQTNISQSAHHHDDKAAASWSIVSDCLVDGSQMLAGRPVRMPRRT